MSPCTISTPFSRSASAALLLGSRVRAVRFHPFPSMCRTADPPCLPVAPVIKTLRLLPAMIFETLPYKRFSLPLRLGNSAGRHPRRQCEICLAAKIRGVLSREVFERCRFLPGDIRDRRCNTGLFALPTKSELLHLPFGEPFGRSGIQDCLLRRLQWHVHIRNLLANGGRKLIRNVEVRQRFGTSDDVFLPSCPVPVSAAISRTSTGLTRESLLAA